jgi:CHASE2 domain-containing sensor protein
VAEQAHAQIGHRVGQAGKLAELIILGLIVGAVSIVLSFLWNRYAFLASDTAQHLTADLVPPAMPAKVILIDIGERSCLEWAKQNHGGICALLPRLSHSGLAAVFKKLEQTNPKLVVVDIDLQSEAPTAAVGPEPFSWPKSITPDEESIRQSVLRMVGTPFLVAQHLIKVPDGKQGYEYYAARTILHDVTKSNLFFGHIEQLIDSDGVMRRFQATLRVRNPGANSPDPVPHLALKACEAIVDPELCGREPGRTQASAATRLMFGSNTIDANDYVQFRYVLPRDASRLFDRNVISLEAIDVNRSAIDVTAFDGAIVFLGSTARGRGDYHITPLNVAAGETAGIVIVMNEVLAALLDRRLTSPSFLTVSIEKLFFILASAGLIFLFFWMPFIKRYGASGFFDLPCGTRARIILRFIFVVALLLVINALAIVLISFYSLRHGEIADPITPVVAAVFDVVVDVCAITGHKVATMADKYWAEWRDGRQ